MIDEFDQLYIEDRTLIESFFFGMSATYEDAKSLLEEDSTSQSGNRNTPQTDDHTQVLLLLGVMLSAVAVMIELKKKKA